MSQSGFGRFDVMADNADRFRVFSPDDYGARFFVKLKDEKELTDGKSHEAVRAIPQSVARNAFEGGADPRHGARQPAGQ